MGLLRAGKPVFFMACGDMTPAETAERNMPPRTECYSHSLSRTYRPAFRFAVFHSGIPVHPGDLCGQQSTGMNRYASINHVHSKDGAHR